MEHWDLNSLQYKYQHDINQCSQAFQGDEKLYSRLKSVRIRRRIVAPVLVKLGRSMEKTGRRLQREYSRPVLNI